MILSKYYLFLILILAFAKTGSSQNFYFGADLSYVNEMDDCGAVYTENGIQKDAYEIFADHNTNLIRLRLWHTPSWYGDLNQGHIYSDFHDVVRSISRAKANNMEVLLDFHLSDSWADPSKQLVPSAWLPVVDHLEILEDSLYNYVYSTLDKLASQELLPDMVQIGNETNRGILLSPTDNQQWTLDWNRNSVLFNSAIDAVRDIESNTNEDIDVLIHLAGPADTEWYVDEFMNNGIIDFDAIGISYYWSWHQPTKIEDTGDVISRIKENYPTKKVIIVETGYIWTTANNDSANNIIDNTDPEYGSPSPENQRDWLIDLTQEVINSGGSGVIYWEPAWVSTGCNTLWGNGSHQENATFFDFDNNLLIPGGIQWSEYPYAGLTKTKEVKNNLFLISVVGDSLYISNNDSSIYPIKVSISNSKGQEVEELIISEVSIYDLSQYPSGMYFITASINNDQLQTASFIKS